MTDARVQIMSEKLVNTFVRIGDMRMAGVPILNTALKVELVGAQLLGRDFVGILVTPWFMNLMILPLEAEGDFHPAAKQGDTVKIALPSGLYPCLMGEEAGLGRYLACSFFSPVFEFATQDAAVETARAIMAELMQKQTGVAGTDTEAEAWGLVLNPQPKLMEEEQVDAEVPADEGLQPEAVVEALPVRPNRRSLFGLGKKADTVAQT